MSDARNMNLRILIRIVKRSAGSMCSSLQAAGCRFIILLIVLQEMLFGCSSWDNSANNEALVHHTALQCIDATSGSQLVMMILCFGSSASQSYETALKDFHISRKLNAKSL